MTESATTQQQMEAAAGSVAAKLQVFHTGLTPDEQQVLALALHHGAAQTDEAAADTAAHMLVCGPTLVGLRLVQQLELQIAVEKVRSVLACLGVEWTPPSQGPGR